MQPDATLSNGALGEVVEHIIPGGRLLQHGPLSGGVSATLTALEVAHLDGRQERLVIRQYGSTDLRQNRQVASHEFNVLRLAHAHGVPVPRPVYLDDAGQLLGSPAIVIEYVDGETVFDPPDLKDHLSQLAAVLARIHEIRDSPALASLKRVGSGFGPRPAALDDDLGEDEIRDALESAWPLDGTNEPALLHGDFWPGNVLWREGEIMAVIDWEDVRVGEPLYDVANCRLELFWAFGEDAMEIFTAAYRTRAAIDLGNLPYWDLVAALRPCGKLSNWGLDPDVERRMRDRHRWFVRRALDRLKQR